jgi:uncharacterized protein YigA (DUF484 family)
VGARFFYGIIYRIEKEDYSPFTMPNYRQHALIEELTRCNTEMQEDFETKLALLNQRGQLNQSELKKITDLNAEIFGHSNNRQKIRYVAQLKEENLALKKVDIDSIQKS